MAFKDSDIRQHIAELDLDVRVTGIEDIERNIANIVENVVREAGITTKEAAGKLLLAAQQQVPYDTGDLHDSGKAIDVTVSQYHPEWEVLFDDRKAMMVHEIDQDYGQGPGPTPSGKMRPHPEFRKKAHFLSDPAVLMAEELHKEVIVRTEAAIQKAPISLKPRLVKKSS